MNRRTFLSALAATSLTPIMPAQIFASGGIVSGEMTACLVGGTSMRQAERVARGYILKVAYRASDDDEWEEVTTSLSVQPDELLEEFLHGSGTWSGGLITS